MKDKKINEVEWELLRVVASNRGWRGGISYLEQYLVIVEKPWANKKSHYRITVNTSPPRRTLDEYFCGLRKLKADYPQLYEMVLSNLDCGVE